LAFLPILSMIVACATGMHDGGGRILNSAGERNESEAFRRPATW
jgi:hypothetical protein